MYVLHILMLTKLLLRVGTKLISNDDSSSNIILLPIV